MPSRAEHVVERTFVKPMSGPRRRWAAAVAVPAAAVLVLTGCDKASTAATVGDQDLSVSSLQKMVRDGLADKTVAGQWNGDQAGLTRQVLNWRVNETLVDQAAKKRGITATPTDVTVVKAAFTQQGIDAATLAKNGVLPKGQDAFARAIALAARLAIANKAVTVPDVLKVGLILAPTRLDAGAVTAELRADPAAYPQIAARYKNTVTSPQPVLRTSTAYSQQFGAPELANALKATQAYSHIIDASTLGSGLKGFVVITVLGVQKGSLAALEAMSDPTEAGQLMTQAFTESTTRALYTKSVKVTVNPRYGSWNASTGQIGDSPDSALSILSATKSAAAGS
jgi:SurA N-terminal domain